MKTQIVTRVTTPLTRRGVLKSMLAAGAAPWIVPAHVRGAEGKTAPSNKITLGVLGVGDQGQADMRGFLGLDDVRVVALCDVNKRNLAGASGHIANAYGSPNVKVFADFRELNADPAIDAVQMTLPEHWHSIPSLDAILRGKHIYYEKPMGMSFEESRRAARSRSPQGRGISVRHATAVRRAISLGVRVGPQRPAWQAARHRGLGPGGRSSRSFPSNPCPIGSTGIVGWDRPLRRLFTKKS